MSPSALELAARCDGVAQVIGSGGHGGHYLLVMVTFGEVDGFALRTSATPDDARAAVARWTADGRSDPPGPPPSPQMEREWRQHQRDLRGSLGKLCLPGTGFALLGGLPIRHELTIAGREALRALGEAPSA